MQKSRLKAWAMPLKYLRLLYLQARRSYSFGKRVCFGCDVQEIDEVRELLKEASKGGRESCERIGQIWSLYQAPSHLFHLPQCGRSSRRCSTPSWKRW